MQIFFEYYLSHVYKYISRLTFNDAQTTGTPIDIRMALDSNSSSENNLSNCIVDGAMQLELSESASALGSIKISEHLPIIDKI